MKKAEGDLFATMTLIATRRADINYLLVIHLHRPVSVSLIYRPKPCWLAISAAHASGEIV